MKGDEILRTDPGSLARQSITMIYTPKTVDKTPEQPPVNGVSSRQMNCADDDHSDHQVDNSDCLDSTTNCQQKPSGQYCKQ